MTQQEADKLIERYLKGDASPAEEKILLAWYESNSSGKSLTDSDDFEHLYLEIWSNTQKRAGLVKKNAFPLWSKIAVAASVVLAFLIIFEKNPKQLKDKVTFTAKKTYDSQITPGGNKAILTLGNGRKINLSEVKNGDLAQENNINIKKSAQGEIAYTSNGKSSALVYNTITTPRGGQYSITLSDGTKVTLNAASSMTFPTRFANKERKIQINGEAYLEVAHNKKVPFRIVSKGQEIEVLGTEFNINSYEDEPLVKTTLVKGSVKLKNSSSSVILKPGEQGQVNNSNSSRPIAVQPVDLEEITAWKNGHFEFNESSLSEVLRTTARWYDIDVNYSGKVPDLKISGKISRKVNFSGLVALLEFEGVKFRINKKSVEIIN